MTTTKLRFELYLIFGETKFMRKQIPLSFLSTIFPRVEAPKSIPCKQFKPHDYLVKVAKICQ